MIRRLRRKLILTCMVSLALVLAVILGGVNLMSYHKVVSDADAILALLNENGGAFPSSRPAEAAPPEGAPPDRDNPFDPGGISPETPYESRFFSVLLDGSGQPLKVDTGQIVAVDEAAAVEYAQNVQASGRSSGFAGNYRYLVCEEAQGTLVLFLDCGRSLSTFVSTLLTSVLLALLGLLAVLVLLLILSRRIVRPVAESYEKQKQFITDAGYELKTPMTIIGADADLAEMECGENQWITDIRRQAQRLTQLTNDLIYLSRMEEESPRLQPIEFLLSDVAEEMAQSFQAPARSQGKELLLHIQPMLSFTGDEKAIRQLLSILLDNALKYSADGAPLTLGLEKQGRAILLTVSNTVDKPIDRDKLPHLFDRFYRMDPSRSSETGGYGLGLSIARSIVLAHRGKIRAESPDGMTLTFVVHLPL